MQPAVARLSWKELALLGLMTLLIENTFLFIYYAHQRSSTLLSSSSSASRWARDLRAALPTQSADTSPAGQHALPTPTPPLGYADVGSTFSMSRYFGDRFPLLPASQWFHPDHDLDLQRAVDCGSGSIANATRWDRELQAAHLATFELRYVPPRFYPSRESVINATGLKFTPPKPQSYNQIKQWIRGENVEPRIAVLLDAIVSRTGSVLTNSTFIPAYPDQHLYRGLKLDVVGSLAHNTPFKSVYYMMDGTYARNGTLGEVLVIAHEHLDMYWHRIVSEFYRVLPALPFLLANPQVYVHVGVAKDNSKTLALFEALGIARTRLVSGKIKADVVYLTQAVDRDEVPGLPHALMGREQLHNALGIPLDRRTSVLCPASYEEEDDTEDATPTPKRRSARTRVVNVLLMVREDVTRGRMIVNQMELEEALVSLSEAYRDKRISIKISRHTADLSMADTYNLFARADVVLGPHGAGFANLYAVRTCAHVVETRHLNILTCGRLGLAYHGCLAEQTQDGLDPKTKLPRAFNFRIDVAHTVGLIKAAIDASDLLTPPPPPCACPGQATT